MVCVSLALSLVPLSTWFLTKGVRARISRFTQAFSPGSETQHHVPLRDSLSQDHGSGGGSAGCGYCTRYRDEGLRLAGGALWQSRLLFLKLVEQRTRLCCIPRWDGDWSEIPNPANASIFPRG